MDVARVVNIGVIAEGHLLVVRRSPTDSLPGMWEIPGGAVEPGETFAEAAARELQEETGLPSEGLAELFRLQGPAPTGFRQARIEVGLFHMGRDRRPEVRLAPSEHTEHRWLRPSELTRLPMMDLNRSLAILASARLAAAPLRP